MLRPREGLEIDGFTIGPCLHRGGFATIWEATHPDHKGRLAMKVPTILDGFDAPTIVGFEIEQMIVPRLTGPHVPRVVALGDFSSMPYIVTEWIGGGSLLGPFAQAPLPLSDVLEMAARMTEAVVDLHRQHVIHFDLKPANFLRRDSGEYVAIDYGLARHDLLPDLLAEEFTVPLGTFPYMAPEQYLKQRDDLRSDIFALGAMFYELCTGHPPWGEPASLRGVRKRLWRDPVPPRALVPALPEWFQEIVLRCLEVDPQARYQSAGQLLFDLQNPAQVRLTARARRTRADGRLAVFRRWRRMRGVRRLSDPVSVSAQMDQAPVLMVAVDLSPEAEALNRHILTTLRRMLAVQPDARVSCVNILRTARIGIDQATDDAGEHLHVMRLVALRDWGAELELDEGRISFSVLESSDPAGAIIAHANRNRVDHILMGARGHSATRRYLGSVSAQVVSEAASSVTVVRLPESALPQEDAAEVAA